MPRENSLKRADFLKMNAARPRREYGAFFSLSIGPSAGGGSASGGKFAVVVSKKVSPKAVVRNLIKRRTRDALRHKLKNFDKPLLLAFHAKPAARDAAFDDIARDIHALLSRI
ncbi:ribonuclease P protein component [Candidatus Kaiserbacteria bacterium]|nr:ribonuclease P protein component [Candidatus Kaiserbacteria bacterium]